LLHFGSFHLIALSGRQWEATQSRSCRSPSSRRLSASSGQGLEPGFPQGRARFHFPAAVQKNRRGCGRVASVCHFGAGSRLGHLPACPRRIRPAHRLLRSPRTRCDLRAIRARALGLHRGLPSRIFTFVVTSAPRSGYFVPHSCFA
jgi:hypothetical protein